ncbi:hypothetical protein BATDEDRAFT_27588 [Batrachochytrium dendrobatidis JAM81]|uniref:Uncharacterized protein n=1 Tax=Batrachochytrium dendrobatidis (strain JAM81 / FGSC 10211) TaxID=684364 RepID=F4PBB3_BATDJ|nr:uncharacterized protein BATDEDRAFT_27588 [Batrachochytrium dendrobatidis JAM81]EGF77413.1 hypothetical protein BATDEDRAFT_27588 [Batrachochytrium dendrobatidis JAM81]|eukprot:XP_006681913.1 hypothetical protein BATDEDRAFT_27588 [Batrachochytrium dendrobatidis JAM81]
MGKNLLNTISVAARFAFQKAENHSAERDVAVNKGQDLARQTKICNMLRRLPTSITLTQADITELDQLREKQANEKGSCQSERNQDKSAPSVLDRTVALNSANAEKQHKTRDRIGLVHP